MGLIHLNFGDDNCPRQHPEEIRAKRLVKVSAGNCCEEYRRELVVQRVENVAPIDILASSVFSRRAPRTDLLATLYA